MCYPYDPENRYNTELNDHVDIWVDDGSELVTIQITYKMSEPYPATHLQPPEPSEVYDLHAVLNGAPIELNDEQYQSVVDDLGHWF